MINKASEEGKVKKIELQLISIKKNVPTLILTKRNDD